MNPENLEKSISIIKENLEPLADKIGQGVGWTYELFVRQTYVEAISSFLCLPFGVAFLVLAKKIYKTKPRKPDYSDIIEPNVLRWTGVLAFGFIGMLITLDPIDKLVRVLVNPHYQAIKLIIDLVKTQTVQ